MKLWLLRPGPDKSAWDPWYDKCFGFVIRAETEEAARQIGSENHGDEHPYHSEKLNPWNDSLQSTCVELAAEVPAGIVMRDFRAA